MNLIFRDIYSISKLIRSFSLLKSFYFHDSRGGCQTKFIFLKMHLSKFISTFYYFMPPTHSSCLFCARMACDKTKFVFKLKCNVSFARLQVVYYHIFMTRHFLFVVFNPTMGCNLTTLYSRKAILFSTAEA